MRIDNKNTKDKKEQTKRKEKKNLYNLKDAGTNFL
jgi:hypothetical protein